MQSLPAGWRYVGGPHGSQNRQVIFSKTIELDLSISGINAPRKIVLSGKATDIQKIESILSEKDIRAITLNVSHAFHSKTDAADM